jgi:hypothetical protein
MGWSDWSRSSESTATFIAAMNFRRCTRFGDLNRTPSEGSRSTDFM